MMKIALLSYDWGEYSIRLASALAQQSEVCLLAPRQLTKPHLAKLDPAVHFHAFDKPRLRQPLQQLRTIGQLLRVIRNFAPDLIHIQQGHFWFNFVLPFLGKMPLVVTIHDPRHHLGDRGAQNTPQWIYDFGFRRAHQLIVHAKQMAQMTIDEVGIEPEKLHVIPHILLGDEGELPAAQTEPNTIMFFGRIWAYKGLEYLIRAQPLITARVPDAKIVIAGEGEDFSRYREMMVQPERFVVHNEYVSHEKRSTLFAEAAIVVLPYVEATQSGVIPLAYNFGKPVVATTVGGLPEMVDHGETGYLVPPCDAEALADAVVDLLQNQERQRQFGRNGYHKLHQLCSPAIVARQTSAVYTQALHERGGKVIFGEAN